MLGSNSTYFHQPKASLLIARENAYTMLRVKGYYLDEVDIYMNAFDYFCKNPSQFDGATIVKDLMDIPGIDLDAMLHDYHYINYNVAASFITKWKADWLYAKGQERKGKGLYSAYSRFVGLSITGIGWVPYVFLKKGRISETEKSAFFKEYKLLIK